MSRLRDPDAMRPESDVLLLSAFAMFAMAVRGATVVNLLYVVLACGMLAIVALLRFRSGIESPISARRLAGIAWAFAAALCASAFFDVRLPPLEAGRETVWHGIALVWMATVFATFILHRRRTVPITAVLVASTVIATAGFIAVVRIDPEPTIDVWEFHHNAADRLAEGQSPYHDLAVASSSPNDAPGTIIDGYVYPPVTLLWFSVGAWAGDARLAIVVAWIVINLVFAVITLSWVRPLRSLALGSLLLFAAQPGYLFIVDQSWTEPFTLMLLALTLVLWSKHPTVSGLFLGLALVSKQYMLVLGAALLLLPDPDRRRRLAAAASAGIVLLLPFLLWDTRGIWESTVIFHLETPPRTDASNLAGLGLALGIDLSAPTWLALLVPAGIAAWMGRRARDIADLALAMAAGLAAFFLLASQAFANYWFLVGGLTMLSLLLRPAPADAPPTGAASTSSRGP